ncbi:RNA ligase family protein [Limnofasciculus baicalensis]|uniref:RNA ligase n=1 Tax=Limnofasciculus baicalensis BBK-W-15 TaxID=2699891 RepID=A0AAE3GXB4_9CYAN|nr:RNA ligase family protein [Limnofasciculus baicalensis]MCP2732249.1 RNA ligase [Limnofasciculus baicalensis BBK-W-15]
MEFILSEIADWSYETYEKIPDNFNKWNLTESDYRNLNKTDWVVTEKIHGANFGIVTNGLIVWFAKRKEFLSPDDNFFDYQSIAHNLTAQAKEIFRIYQTQRQGLQRVFIYGELFGGEYPHPDVPAIPHLQAVQTGIYYSPKIEYCAFDIAVEEKGKSVKLVYLDYDNAIALFQEVGTIYAVPLFMGRYQDALTYNIDFDSTIPALLGLPTLPFPNPAEGIVIKPVKSIYVETPKGKIRPILKIKIPKFAEDSRFHQATKWISRNSTTPTSTQDLTIEEELTQEMLSLITETRLNNVISKFGRVSGSDRESKEQLVELFVGDVLETFNEEWGSIFRALSDESQEVLMVRLTQESQKLICG